MLRSLEPQMAAGSEILFTAVSYDDPSLDITQFGDEGTIVPVFDGGAGPVAGTLDARACAGMRVTTPRSDHDPPVAP